MPLALGRTLLPLRRVASIKESLGVNAGLYISKLSSVQSTVLNRAFVLSWSSFVIQTMVHLSAVALRPAVFSANATYVLSGINCQ